MCRRICLTYSSGTWAVVFPRFSARYALQLRIVIAKLAARTAVFGEGTPCKVGRCSSKATQDAERSQKPHIACVVNMGS